MPTRRKVSFAYGTLVTPTRLALVWARSEAAEVAGTETPIYALAVVSDTYWQFGALYEDWDNGLYCESIEAVVSVTPLRLQATRHLTLTAPYTLARPLWSALTGGRCSPSLFVKVS